MRTEEQKQQIEKSLSEPYMIENFITNEERLQLIDYFNKNDKKIHKITGPITLHLDESDYKTDLFKNILEKIKNELNSEVYFGHFFYTKVPHIIHNDDSYDIVHPYKGINIPLETFEDTYLCIFEQYYLDGPSKFFNGSTDLPTYYNTQVYEYSNVKNLSSKVFDEELRNTYFNHLEKKWLEGLSIKTIFKQIPNCGIVFDTVRLHCSSKFNKSKLGLSFFTKL